jgi:hypothetical protein
MQDEIDQAGPIIDRMNSAIRENPLAAGLIGAGLAWMLLGGAKGFGAVAGAAKGAAGKAGSAAAAAGNAMAGGLSKAASTAASGVKDSVSGIAGSVASIVPDLSVTQTDGALDAASDVRSAIGHHLDTAAATGREYGAAVQSRLSESLERQPLLLGAIGLAIGAGIASTFATTAVESELMGEQGTAAREKLQDLADDVTERATQVIADVKDEASRQGLTTDAAKKAAAELGEKIKTAAGAGRDSVAQRFP